MICQCRCRIFSLQGLGVMNVSCLIALFLLPALSATAAARGVYYCGPVTYEYLKTVEGGGTSDPEDDPQWEATVHYSLNASGKWLICLKGSPLMPVFSAESLNSEVAFTLSSNKTKKIWEKVTRCPTGVERSRYTGWTGPEPFNPVSPGNTEENTISELGKKFEGNPALKGTMMLGNSVYILQLVSGIGYDYRMQGEEKNKQVCTGVESTIPIRMELPQVFGISIHHEGPTEHAPETISGGFKNEKTTDEAASCDLKRSSSAQCNVIESTSASWSLKRSEGDCLMMVNGVSGDATVNGQKIEPGPRAMGKGDSIQTGAKSRLSISPPGGNMVIRMGSNSTAKVSDWCGKRGGDAVDLPFLKLMAGKIVAMVESIEFGVRPPISITAVTGSRGQKTPFEPFRMALDEHVKFLVKKAYAEEVLHADEIRPEASELEKAAAAYIALVEEKSISIEVLKGEITVSDSKGNRSKILQQGATFSDWDDGSKPEEILVYLGRRQRR
jgi:hypothetical protein